MRYQKPKGQRIKKQFLWVEVNGMWWILTQHVWLHDPSGFAAASCCSLRSVRAFRRMLRKHPYIKGNATLVSRFVGYDVEG